MPTITKKLDQNNNPIPSDLVLLEDPSLFTSEEIELIKTLDWYQPRGISDVVFVSAAKFNELFPEDTFEHSTLDDFPFEACKWNILPKSLYAVTERGFIRKVISA